MLYETHQPKTTTSNSKTIEFPRAGRNAAPIPPNNVEIEEDVLGMLMLDSNAMERVVEHLTPDLFYLTIHQTICKAMLALHAVQQPIDLQTVAVWLNDRGLLEQIGGRPKLSRLVDPIVGAVNVDLYVKKLVDYSKRRQLIQACWEISHLSYDGSTDLDKVLELAQTKVFALSDAGQQTGLVPLSQILEAEVTRLEQIQAGKLGVGYPTGFRDLDAMTQGLHPHELVIVAGRPGMGKSAFAAQVGRNIAAQGLPVALFSLEMGGGEVARRLLAIDASIDSNHLRSARLTHDDWGSLGFAIANLSELPFAIDESQSVTPATILSQCQRLKARSGGLGLIIVDYLHLMAEGEDDMRELGFITRQCKKMARALECPVMLLSQLNRGVESRTNKRPMMSDLRQSGAIEQDADLIVMLYRDEYYNPDTPDRGIAEVILTKQRNGETGTVKLLFEPRFTRFQNLTPRTYGS